MVALNEVFPSCTSHVEAEPFSSRRNLLKASGSAIFASSLAGGTRVSARDQAVKPPTRENPVRMMYNENPLSASEKVSSAMKVALEEEINTYSFFRALGELKKKLAEKNGVGQDQIVIGAGSTEVLRVTALHLLRNRPVSERTIVANSPGYEGMNQYAANMDAKINRIPVLENDLSPDLNRLKAVVEKGAAILNLCNPNNPTGVIVDEETLTPFCREMAKKTYVFVDEAYHEFVTDPKYGSMLPLVKEGLSVLVTRTFSKLFGLAGIRVGYGIGPAKLVAELNRLQTGTVNIVAIRAALAALEDEDFQRLSLASNVEAKEIVMKELAAMGRRVAPGEGNFVFFHTGMPIREFQKAMREKGFLVGRPFPPYLEWCRLSMAMPGQMRLFCGALRDVLGRRSTTRCRKKTLQALFTLLDLNDS